MPKILDSSLSLKVAEFLEENPQGVLEIIGPTASGKTGFSIEVAQFIASKLNREVEIISVDSRQVYKDCDISSAKITKEESQGVVHHGINLVNLDESYDVVKFKAYGFKTIKAILDRGNIPVLCGGTMLWLDAISENYVFSENPSNDGDSIFEKSTQKSAPLWPFLKLGLQWDREVLYDRINRRAEYQFENGLIEETKMVLEKYPGITKSAFTSFGYKEIQAYLEGTSTYEEALKLNQQRNRNYAKRQLTWWRGRADIEWINLA